MVLELPYVPLQLVLQGSVTTRAAEATLEMVEKEAEVKQIKAERAERRLRHGRFPGAPLVLLGRFTNDCGSGLNRCLADLHPRRELLE